jgi:hypothetical protein
LRRSGPGTRCSSSFGGVAATVAATVDAVAVVVGLGVVVVVVVVVGGGAVSAGVFDVGLVGSIVVNLSHSNIDAANVRLYRRPSPRAADR